jgi:hypothetical protein
MIPRYIFYNSNNFTSSTKIRNGYTDYHQHSMKSLYISESLPYVSFNASIERHQATLYFYLTPCLRNCAILVACISILSDVPKDATINKFSGIILVLFLITEILFILIWNATKFTTCKFMSAIFCSNERNHC